MQKSTTDIGDLNKNFANLCYSQLNKFCPSCYGGDVTPHN